MSESLIVSRQPPVCCLVCCGVVHNVHKECLKTCLMLIGVRKKADSISQVTLFGAFTMLEIRRRLRGFLGGFQQHRIEESPGCRLGCKKRSFSLTINLKVAFWREGKQPKTELCVLHKKIIMLTPVPPMGPTRTWP